MNRDINGPSIRQAIFTMDLPVEAVSVYLLCCAIADAGAAITLSAIEGKWNGSPSALHDELSRLENRQILSREHDHELNAPVYRLEPEKRWR